MPLHSQDSGNSGAFCGCQARLSAFRRTVAVDNETGMLNAEEIHAIESALGLLGAAATVAAGPRRRAAPARAQIHIAVAGPMTGEYAAFGDADEGRRTNRRSPTSTKPAACWGNSSCWTSATMPAIPSRRFRSPTSWPPKRSSWWPAIICSGSSIPASKVYSEEGILQISPASTNPEVYR